MLKRICFHADVTNMILDSYFNGFGFVIIMKLGNLFYSEFSQSQTALGQRRIAMFHRYRTSWAECLALLTCIWEVSGSNLDNLLNVLVDFLSPSMQIPGQYFQLCRDRFHPYPFRFIILIILTIRRSTVCIIKISVYRWEQKYT